MPPVLSSTLFADPVPATVAAEALVGFRRLALQSCMTTIRGVCLPGEAPRPLRRSAACEELK